MLEVSFLNYKLRENQMKYCGGSTLSFRNITRLFNREIKFGPYFSFFTNERLELEKPLSVPTKYETPTNVTAIVCASVCNIYGDLFSLAH